MTKVVIADLAANTLTISASAWAALANVASIQSGAVTNTLIEIIVSKYIASGLRWHQDHRLTDGQTDKAGITDAYLIKVKNNSE